MKNKQQSIGALWTVISKKGTKYSKGNIIVDGKKHEIVIFSNSFKDKEDPKHETKPDAFIYPESVQ